jgi:hypothetical protein
MRARVRDFQAGVVVHDDVPRGDHRWGVIMTADDDATAVQQINIPSVDIVVATTPARPVASPLRMFASLNHSPAPPLHLGVCVWALVQVFVAYETGVSLLAALGVDTSSNAADRNHSAAARLGKAGKAATLRPPPPEQRPTETWACGGWGLATCAGPAVRVTVNATGNVLLRPLPVGPVK